MTPSPAESQHTPAKPENPPRRNLLIALAAGGLSVAAGVLALVPGVTVFFSPLRRNSKSAQWIRIAVLDSVPEDGQAYRFPVIEQRSDAWNRYPPEPVGAVYLMREEGQDKPRCFTATCPHLGCSVDYDSEDDKFHCPCHASAFSIDGEVLSGPSPRALDDLPVEVRNRDEIWIQFLKFRSGIEAKTQE